MSALPADKPLTIEDYQQIKDSFVLIKNKWSAVKTQTGVNRRLRDLTVDVESLRQAGKLRPDQTFIARRVIDTNIKNEQPPFIAYLKQSRRLAVFKCIDDPTLNVEQLETEFTEGMQYNGWELDYFKCLDGAQLHGWDSIEIEYDASKPLKVGISHIGHENLIIPIDCKQLGANDLIARRFEVTPTQLRTFSRYNFSTSQVSILTGQNAPDRTNLIEIYKLFMKDENGVVWVGWINDILMDWLSAPVKLDLGRRQKVTQTIMQPQQLADGSIIGVPIPQESWQPIDETDFPIKLLAYNLTEQQQITEQKGRGALDDADQEAQTNLWTSMVNGAARANNIYGSPAQDESNGGKLAIVDVELVPDRIYNKKIEFWSPPWPEGFSIQLSQALGSAKQAETGSVDFAVKNREDSRKTATELNIATQQAGLLQSVQVMLFAAWLRDIFNYVWPVVQNLALRNDIKLVATTAQEGQPPQNNIELLAHSFDIKPAGDIDVVQRQEKLQRMQAIWPIIANTPLASVFLIDILKEMFPSDVMRYSQVMMQGNIKNQLLQGALGIMQVLDSTPPEELASSMEANRGQLQQLAMQMQQAIQQP